jgi:hypothetical protein
VKSAEKEIKVFWGEMLANFERRLMVWAYKSKGPGSEEKG